MIDLIITYLNDGINFIESINWLFIGYFLVVNSIYIVLVWVSFFYIRKQQKYFKVFDLEGLFQSDLYKSISILTPAYNEEVNIIDSVEALLQLQYPDFEVIVINDGSTDNTLGNLISHFELYPAHVPGDLAIDHKPIRNFYRSHRYDYLIVIDKENGQKADALNAGINISTKELLCSIDADSILDPDVLKKMLRAFIENDKLIAAGGIVRIANGCTIENYIVKEVNVSKNYLARVQTIEYLRSFLFGRVGWDYFNSLLIISGAFGVFDRKAVIEVNGYANDTVGEDMELIVRLHRRFREKKRKYNIKFLPEPVCWTEVPENWNDLARQRNRWQRGLADSLWRHKKMLFNPSYGRLGLITMPYFVFIELFGPVIEIAGYSYFFGLLITGNLNETFTLLFFTVAILFGVILSISALICEETIFRRYPSGKNIAVLTLYALIENFGYRQIHSWWRFKGVIDFIKGNKQWGNMVRLGLDQSDSSNKKNRINLEIAEKLKLFGYRFTLFFIPALLILLVVNVLVQINALPEVFDIPLFDSLP
mgnify:CR=1 FL=1